MNNWTRPEKLSLLGVHGPEPVRPDRQTHSVKIVQRTPSDIESGIIGKARLIME